MSSSSSGKGGAKTEKAPSGTQRGNQTATQTATQNKSSVLLKPSQRVKDVASALSKANNKVNAFRR